MEQRHYELLIGIFSEHAPNVEVWAYGSRVTGRAHEASDLDIVLRNLLDLEARVAEKLDIVDAIEISMIPFLVDVSDWAALPPWLREDIERNHEVMYPQKRNG